MVRAAYPVLHATHVPCCPWSPGKGAYCFIDKDDGILSKPRVVRCADFEILLNSFSPVLSPVKYLLFGCASAVNKNEVVMMNNINQHLLQIEFINLMAV